MMGRIIELENLVQVEKEMRSLGVDAVGIELMAPKALSKILKLKGIRPPAANILKQEMLSLGGEAATAYGAINYSIAETDVLVLGTLKQLRLLAEKLKLHPFGLPEVASEIQKMLNNYDGYPKPIQIGDRIFEFGQRTFIMGVLNVTPDSFSDGGKFLEVDSAVTQARQMLEDGADIIDVGGESTRPGSAPVSAEEEKRRVLPVIEKIKKENPRALISIDTTKAEVAEVALQAGAAMINDISGLHFDANLASIAAQRKVPICLMHIQGQPQKMQENPAYSDLMGEIINYLEKGLEIAQRAGILAEKIMIDPGIGFGKTVEHNLEILRRLRELKVLGRPILVGTSRKSLIGKILNLPVEERLEGTAATVALSIANGADIIRVHDVKEISRVARMTDAIVRGNFHG